jgi:RNA polymerase sigma-70 factor (ECF subfamily)
MPKFPMSNDQIADLQQTLRTRLLADGAIGTFQGHSKLVSFVLVAAMREAVRSRERSQREPAIEEDTLIALADRADVLPIAPEKARYRDAFRTSFRAALGALEPRDRNLLRMHLVDALSIDQLGLLAGS